MQKKLVMLLALLLLCWVEAANSSNIEFEKNWKSISPKRWISFFCIMKKVYPVIITLLIGVLLIPSSCASVRGFLLNMGFSWMLSEWMYYAMLAMLGASLAWTLAQGVNWKSAWKKYIVILCSVLAPFAIGFAEHPIYEDMLWDLSADMSTVKFTSDYADADLVVIAIADCPYCKRAVTELKAMHERNPDMRMRMVVCTADSVWLEPYEQEANDAFEVVMATDMDMLATQAGGHFPAYVLVRDGKPVCRWSNNEWGPLAKDVVEKGEGRGTRDEAR
jgi:hypothetical protein